MKREKELSKFWFLLVVVSLALLAGCATKGPSGRWQVDAAVQKAFEAGEVFPDHTYYYLGSIAAPDSIIAIDNHYTLRTRVWAQIDITPEILRGWLSWYRTQNFTACDYYGGVILAPDGQRAGIWYSQNVINIIQMPEPGVLEVFQPHSISGATCGALDDGMWGNGRD